MPPYWRTFFLYIDKISPYNRQDKIYGTMYTYIYLLFSWSSTEAEVVYAKGDEAKNLNKYGSNSKYPSVQIIDFT